MIKIGDTLWQFDQNRREYSKPEPGRIHGALIYRSHFAPQLVVGETPRSWLVGKWNPPTKVSKSGLHEAGPRGHHGYQWFTTEGMADDIWKQDNRRRIVDMVERAGGTTLRKVAEVVGYKEKS